MAEALKLAFDAAVVRSLARDLARAHAPFDARAFERECLDGLDALELVARGTHVADALRRHLPADGPAALDVLERSLGAPLAATEGNGMTPFRYLPHASFVARFTLDHFEAAMKFQHALTQRFTAEFSIRAYLERHPERTLERLRAWTRDPSAHVRRLVSEGTRPRLPWAPRLRAFQRDPAPVLELLARLRDDGERYVQRSVANNLNDIGKDHPERLVEVCRAWLADAPPPGRRWLVGHALRSRVKAGDAGALAVLGHGGRPKVAVHDAEVAPRRARLGERVRFTCVLESTAARAQSLVVDFAVFYVKKNGTRSPKVFKLRKVALARGAREALAGSIDFVERSTRKHHAGPHAIELRVNGVAFPLGVVDLRV